MWSYRVSLYFLMCLNTITVIFYKMSMEIKITAAKTKSNFIKQTCSINSTDMTMKAKYLPFFELMARELEKQSTETQRSISL